MNDNSNLQSMVNTVSRIEMLLEHLESLAEEEESCEWWIGKITSAVSILKKDLLSHLHKRKILDE